MMETSVKEARLHFKRLLDSVEQGEEILITRRGRPIARLMPSGRADATLPPLAEFRANLRLKGPALSQTVITLRREERY